MVKRLICLGAIVSVVGILVGCERTDTELTLVLVEVDSGQSSVSVEAGNAVTFRASLPEDDDDTREIYYPLEWSLSDPSIGALRGAAGDTVVYEAGPFAGAGSITVRDQIGATGSASISQSTNSLTSGGN